MFSYKLKSFLNDKKKFKLKKKFRENLLMKYLNTNQIPNTKKITEAINSIRILN